MSDVALVAAITGGSSVLTSGVTAAVTWAVSKNSSSVELAKVAAENDRLQQANREDERRNRQTAYHNYIDVINSIHQVLGAEIANPRGLEMFKNFNHLSAGAALFGPPSVRKRVIAISSVYNRIWPAFEEQEQTHPEKAEKECWADATSALKDEFNQCAGKLVASMHADVTRGIVDDPS